MLRENKRNTDQNTLYECNHSHDDIQRLHYVDLI